MAYIGTPAAIGFSSTKKDSFSGDNSTTGFTMSKAANTGTDIQVFVDNIRQEPTTAYSVSGATLTFTEAPPTGTNNVYVIHQHQALGTGPLPPQDFNWLNVTPIEEGENPYGNNSHNLIGFHMDLFDFARFFDLYENKVDLTVKKAPAPTPAVVLPDYKPPATTVSEPVAEAPINAPMAQDFGTPQEIVQPEITTPEVKSIPNIPAVVSETPVAAPTPEVVVGIWPWSPSESWDARVVHREVVSALEQVKSGHISEATSTIDALGPHLSDDNIDLIYHIGMVLKQIGRTDEVKSMLERAKLAMPDNEHVSSAVAHLDV